MSEGEFCVNCFIQTKLPFTGTSNTLSGETRVHAPKIKSYAETKQDFEKYACRVDDVLVYPYTDKAGNVQLYNRTQLRKVLGCISYYISRRFVSRWIFFYVSTRRAKG